MKSVFLIEYFLVNYYLKKNIFNYIIKAKKIFKVSNYNAFLSFETGCKIDFISLYFNF
jgi:hypothetical protein